MKSYKRKVLASICAILMIVPYVYAARPQPTSGDGILSTSYIWEGYGGYVAHGVWTWGSTSGTITIDDIPSGAIIKEAFIYWVCPSSIGVDTYIIVNGNGVTGTLVGSDGVLRGYGADITGLVAGNGNYAVTDISNAYGVSIVAVYSHTSSPYVTVIINDGMDSNWGESIPHWLTETVFSGFTASSNPSAYVTYIMGDGQIYYQGAYRYDKYSFNGIVIATDEADGSDGGSYDHGWDTDTYDVSSYVSAGDTIATANVYEDNDELNWVTQVFSITSIAPAQNPPIADVNGPYFGYEGSPVTFDASSSSDPDGDILQYRWDFDNDGLWDTSWSLSPNANFTWGDDYNGAVTVEVYDGVFSDTDSAAVILYNVAPVVSAGCDQTVFEGETLYFNGGFSDPGWLDSHDIEWDFDDGNIITGNLTPMHVYGDNWIYTVILTVTDDDGGVGIDTIEISVNNLGPSGGIIDISYASEGSPATFIVNASDPGSDDMIFTWDWGDGTPATVVTFYNDVTDPDPNPSPWGTYPFSVSDTLSHVFGDDSDYTITLIIADDDGGKVIYTTIVSVANVAPTIAPIGSIIGDEASPISITTSASDPGSDDLTFIWDFELGPTITNIYYNDGIGEDPDPSPGGSYPFIVTDTAEHAYGDDGIFSITLKVQDDDGGMTSYTTTQTVRNLAPMVTLDGPSTVDENSPITFSGRGIDPGSDDLTFTWKFEIGPVVSSIYYNDGTAPDPSPSPNINPMDITDGAGHTYGDDGVFEVTLTVEDDDGGITTVVTTVIVDNVEPIANIENPGEVNENDLITVAVTSYDPGSDDLTVTLDWGDGFSSSISNIYFNDRSGPDQYPSPDINPISVTDTQSHIYGDNGIFTLTITVSDDDGGNTVQTIEITVNNIDPTIVITDVFMLVNITLRVAGEKYHSVGIQLYEDGLEIWTATVTRYPGNPDRQIATISGLTLNLKKTYSATVDYLPNDPGVNGKVWGGNPVWIDITFENGTTKRIHHTFNVRQSYWDSDHWNHIDPWEVDLNAHLVGYNFEIAYNAVDPGSDDETLTFAYGAQTVTVIYLNNPPIPDPYPSPQVSPVAITSYFSLIYEGPGVLSVTIEDDDKGTDTTVIHLG